MPSSTYYEVLKNVTHFHKHIVYNNLSENRAKHFLTFSGVRAVLRSGLIRKKVKSKQHLYTA